MTSKALSMLCDCSTETCKRDLIIYLCSPECQILLAFPRKRDKEYMCQPNIYSEIPAILLTAFKTKALFLEVADKYRNAEVARGSFLERELEVSN